MSIPPTLRRLIAERDQNRCAYCLTTEENSGQRMHVDHIIPDVADGPTVAENLCLACFTCNSHKGEQQSGFDPLTGATVQFFHPLRQSWDEHFAWDESKTQIIGLTPCGRATVIALQMNNSLVGRARRRWVDAGWHPPHD